MGQSPVMRKIFLILLFAVTFSAARAATGISLVSRSATTSEKSISVKTPVGFMVQNFFRKIFTGKEQMSERKKKRILRRQK